MICVKTLARLSLDKKYGDNTEKYIRIMQFRFPNKFVLYKRFDDETDEILGMQVPGSNYVAFKQGVILWRNSFVLSM